MGKLPDDWFEQYKIKKASGMTNNQIAAELGVHIRTLQYKLSLIPKPADSEEKKKSAESEHYILLGMDLAQRAQALLNQRSASVEELSEKLKAPPNVIRHVMDRLVEYGNPIRFDEDQKLWRYDQKAASGKKFNHSSIYGKRIKFAMVSDTHLGNELCNIEALHDFYDRAKKAGCKAVYHSGDVLDGQNMFPGHENELLVIGAGKQVKYCAENYPKNGLETYFILGNHEIKSWFDRGGNNVGPEIEKLRPDMHFLGMYEADIELAPRVILRMIHPDWGSAYALTYSGQRFVDNMPIYGQPAIMQFGHIHSSYWFERRGMQVVLVGTFKRHGTWEKRKGWAASIGGFLAEAEVHDGSLIALKLERISYHD